MNNLFKINEIILCSLQLISPRNPWTFWQGRRLSRSFQSWLIKNYISVAHIWSWWIHPRFKVSLFSIPLECLVKVRDRNSIVHYLGWVLNRVVKKIRQISILLLFVYLVDLPFVDMLSVPYQNIEIWIQQQNYVFTHVLKIQCHSLRIRIIWFVHY